MNIDTEHHRHDRDLMLSRAEWAARYIRDRLIGVLSFVALWLIIGAFLVVFEWGDWPDSILGWAFWIVLAPAIYILAEILFHLLLLPLYLLGQIPLVKRVLQKIKTTPPVPQVASWARSADSDGQLVYVIIFLVISGSVLGYFALLALLE